MFKSISLAELMSAITQNVESNTGFKCCDTVPAGIQEPYYYVEIMEKTPRYNKLFKQDSFVVRFHAMPLNRETMAPTYDMLDKLEESFTQEIDLPESFELYSQQSNGIEKLEIEEFNETRTVAAYNFVISCAN